MDLAKVLLIVRWLLGKGDVVPKLLDLWERVQAVTTFTEYVALFQELLAIIKDELADFPELNVFFSAEDSGELESSLKAEAAAAGRDWSKLIEIAKLILTLAMLFAEKNNPQA